MKYNFYDELTEDKKNRYNLMLLTSYILLRCDEWSFIETDENDHESISVSWIQSIQPTLELFGLKSESYPQGSISANRNYYESLNNFLGSDFYCDKEFHFLRNGIRNFIRLRCDDTSPFKSYLYGSFFRIEKQIGVRDPYKYRHIDVSLRHSATALWILTKEVNQEENITLTISLNNFFNRMNSYLEKDEAWQRDHFKHLTLSSTINLCNSILIRNFSEGLINICKTIKEKCMASILSNNCLEQTIDGEYKWRIPSSNQHKMATYEYYLNTFSLTQIPELLMFPQIISIVKGMLQNLVKTPYGYGIPINSYQYQSDDENMKADFGASASVLYLLWYTLTNDECSSEWKKYCQYYFKIIFDFCLNAFDKKECYILPHSENNSKILLLPCFVEKQEIIDSHKIITNIKNCIKDEFLSRNNKLYKNLNKVKLPDELIFIKNIIRLWKIPTFWRKQKRWDFVSTVFNGPVGEFFGGILKSLMS